jgi:hypothetical protein
MNKQRIFDGHSYSLDGTAEDKDVADRVADGERRDGRKARVTWTGKRGVKMNDGSIRRNTYAIWVCWE